MTTTAKLSTADAYLANIVLGAAGFITTGGPPPQPGHGHHPKPTALATHSTPLASATAATPTGTAINAVPQATATHATPE